MESADESAESPRRGGDRAGMVELASAVGRVEAIVSRVARDTESIITQLTNHERRIVALETDREARERSHNAATQALADERANEDRWGRQSPRAVIIAIFSSGAIGAIAAVVASSLH